MFCGVALWLRALPRSAIGGVVGGGVTGSTGRLRADIFNGVAVICGAREARSPNPNSSACTPISKMPIIRITPPAATPTPAHLITTRQ